MLGSGRGDESGGYVRRAIAHCKSLRCLSVGLFGAAVLLLWWILRDASDALSVNGSSEHHFSPAPRTASPTPAANGVTAGQTLYRTDDCTHDRDEPPSDLFIQLLTPPPLPIRVWDPAEYSVDAAVSHVLRYWSRSDAPPLTRELIQDRAIRGYECILIQVVDGVVWFYSPGYESFENTRGSRFLAQRRVEAVEWVSRVVQEMRDQSGGDARAVPNFELAYCVGDCTEADDQPTFVHVQSDHSLHDRYTPPANLPFPWFDRAGSMDDWNRTISDIVSARRDHPWDARQSKAVFRGDTRSCSGAGEEPDTRHPAPDEPAISVHLKYTPNADSLQPLCGRDRLQWITDTCSSARHLFDVSVRGYRARSTYDRFAHWWSRQFRTASVQPDSLSMRDQDQSFKYIVYAEGHCQWANRLRELLWMGMAVIKQSNVMHEFYDLAHPPPSTSGGDRDRDRESIGLEPWVHYIPVDHSFNNLPEVVLWASQNDAAVQQIIANMNRYAETVTSPKAVLKFARTLFERYAGLLRDPVVVHPRAVRYDYVERGIQYLRGSGSGAGAAARGTTILIKDEAL